MIAKSVILIKTESPIYGLHILFSRTLNLPCGYNDPISEERAKLLETGNTPPSGSGYFDLSGKVAVVTGASSGLGQHFSRVLARAGCKVALLARRQERLDALAAELNRETAGEAMTYAVDVSDRSAVGQALSAVCDKLGSIDILVNNAGIGTAGNFLDADPEETEQLFAVNQHAVWHVAQQTAQHMVKAGNGGSIINIASILGLRVMPGAASYAVSKAAVVHMTEVMALELARYNIRANAMAPGYFSTEMNSGFLESDAGKNIIKRVPMRRTGEYDELDGLLLLLASQKGSFITGTTIPIDGGHCISSL